ncbi:MAG: galactose-1-phosphate uridylyltransferase [Dehalococcoidia bacterium]|nr:galactose-1-phosphate uridylyltransferase [Dehalococcoidia bacterium]
MSELRLDPTTREWVVISTERARRPHDFAQASIHPLPQEFYSTCPFCPGNEAQTPGLSASYSDPESGKWRVRVVPNKFPAVRPEGSTRRKEEHPLALSLDGVGIHEVVVESPLHNRLLGFMSDDEVFDVVRAYRDRLVTLSAMPSVRQVTVFKNHGASAGTSLEHPHSQIVATPVVPWHVRHQYDVATQYFDERGRNLYSDLLAFEAEQEVRVVCATPRFLVIHPYASRRPFETWVLPRSARASLGDLDDDELREFGTVMRDTLRCIFTGLNNPDYNQVLYTAPAGDECEPYYSWHLRVYPRLTAVAGFEIGSGIHINTSLPEQTAAFMREIASSCCGQ